MARLFPVGVSKAATSKRSRRVAIHCLVKNHVCSKSRTCVCDDSPTHPYHARVLFFFLSLRFVFYVSFSRLCGVLCIVGMSATAAV